MFRHDCFAHPAAARRKAFAAVLLFGVGLFGAGAVPAASQAGLRNGLEHPYPAPEFVDLGNWLNSPPLSLHGLKGKVVLVDFWSYSCINCIHTLPYVSDWDRQYRSRGLVIVGIHAPEFEYEKTPDNVKAAAARYGIQYPVAQDNDLATWSAFHNRYWPALYLIDRDGQVVYTHYGEGEYEVIENNLRALLGLKAASLPAEAPDPATE